MVIVLASFIVLGSVMMFVFSQYTKSDKRKLLMQNASSMASITSVVDITNNGAPELLKCLCAHVLSQYRCRYFRHRSRGPRRSVPMPTAPQISAPNFIPQTKISAGHRKCASEGSYTGDGRKNGIYDTPYYVVGVPLYSVAETSSSEAGGENSTRVPVGAVFARHERCLPHGVSVRRTANVPHCRSRRVHSGVRCRRPLLLPARQAPAADVRRSQKLRRRRFLHPRARHKQRRDWPACHRVQQHGRFALRQRKHEPQLRRERLARVKDPDDNHRGLHRRYSGRHHSAGAPVALPAHRLRRGQAPLASCPHYVKSLPHR